MYMYVTVLQLQSKTLSVIDEEKLFMQVNLSFLFVS